MKKILKLMGAACAFNIVLSVPAHSQYAESSLQSCLRFEDVLKFSAQRDPDARKNVRQMPILQMRSHYFDHKSLLSGDQDLEIQAL